MDAWDNCQREQHRLQVAIIQSEGDEDQQANSMQHKVYPEDANTNRKIPQRADCESPGSLEDIFTDTDLIC